MSSPDTNNGVEKKMAKNKTEIKLKWKRSSEDGKYNEMREYAHQRSLSVVAEMSFKLDEGFCSTCGSILPIPLTNIDEFIKCRCGYKIPFQSCDGMVVSKVEVVFNEMKEKKDKKKKDNKSMSGPTIERVCSHCGHNEMTYKTQQMRSADEGMSIFYYCLKCGKLEKEDS